MKPKVVRKPQPVSIPVSTANRDLTTFEKATSWVDAHGMIDLEERELRVFRAAIDGGGFSVVWNVHRGRKERRDFRSYPEALQLILHILVQDFAVPEALQRQPAIYAFTYNQETIIRGMSRKDKKSGQFVLKNDDMADKLQAWLNVWSLHVYKKPTTGPSPLIDKLRTPKRKVTRERLPIKRERLR